MFFFLKTKYRFFNTPNWHFMQSIKDTLLVMSRCIWVTSPDVMFLSFFVLSSSCLRLLFSTILSFISVLETGPESWSFIWLICSLKLWISNFFIERSDSRCINLSVSSESEDTTAVSPRLVSACRSLPYKRARNTRIL